MSFGDDLTRFTLRADSRVKAVFVAVVEEATRSIVEGSEVTGAPGQPVDTGNLRASWHTAFVSPTEARIATNVEYAPYVEEGINSKGSVTYHNHGPHSVKLTVAGKDQLLAAAERRVPG